VPTSSLKASAVEPSMLIWLLSYTQQRLASLRWPASDAASLDMPSIMSPSPQMA
jgi:hypothetical protein